ncbi:methylamine utilization protein [Aliiglaciecola sp. LCG003]|uniref:methylamine utilization protein n=1 Tax=Aliiglaciecola sp. LCG003 TaxID=3053655 RepID=UPI0025726785|nr:methylamine utilization protein [Aliiglaciecola sp. LCG003]WJG09079.1 methylamine utilization protein [Aliiglaciecola sp. LCG003]
MSSKKISWLVSAIVGLSLDTAWAEQKIRVVNQDGQPVANAVISIPLTPKMTTDNSSVAIMDQINKQFSPQVLVVNKGQQVRFPNSDNIRHHVYSFSAIKPFEIKLYKGSHEAPIEYDKAGVAVLGCNIHDNMVGYIYVAERELAKVTDALGLAMFQSELPETVTIWHPLLSLKQTERMQVPVELHAGEAVAQVMLLKKPPTPSSTFGSKKFGQKG